MLSTVRERWNAFWYEPSAPVDLAVCRVLFFGAFLLYYLRVDFQELAGLPASVWVPTSPFRAAGLGLPSAVMLDVLQWTWRASLLTACLGLASRASTVAAFVLGFYLIGLSECVTRINHSDAIVVVGLAVMAGSRCGDAFSIDALVSAGGGYREQLDQSSGEYTWPVRAMCLVFVSVYFAAGVTKLAVSGIAWVTSDNLSNLLIFGPVRNTPLTRFGQELGRHQALCTILAAVALLLELTLPLALVSNAARRILVPGVFAMQISIRALMGPGFTEFFICGLFWIPWGRLRSYRFSSPRVRTAGSRPVQV